MIGNGVVLMFRDSIFLRSIWRGEFMMYTLFFEKIVL